MNDQHNQISGSTVWLVFTLLLPLVTVSSFSNNSLHDLFIGTGLIYILWAAYLLGSGFLFYNSEFFQNLAFDETFKNHIERKESELRKEKYFRPSKGRGSKSKREEGNH